MRSKKIRRLRGYPPIGIFQIGVRLRNLRIGDLDRLTLCRLRSGSQRSAALASRERDAARERAQAG
jgi:hypothetical protein